MKPKFNKLMIVPYGNYDSSLKTFINRLDEQMNVILEKKIPVDEKIKLYNNVLLQFKNNFDSDEVTGSNNVKIEKLADSLSDKIKNINVKLKNIDTEIKKENEDLKQEIFERNENLTDELNSNFNKVKNELNKNKLYSKLNNTRSNIIKSALNKSIKEKKPPSPMKLQISQKVKRKNNNNLTLIDNRPRKRLEEEEKTKSKRQEKKFIKAKR
jgi:hypothetical protein